MVEGPLLDSGKQEIVAQHIILISYSLPFLVKFVFRNVGSFLYNMFVMFNPAIILSWLIFSLAHSDCLVLQVTPNLYGNLVANTAAGIAGGTGVMPGGKS